VYIRYPLGKTRIQIYWGKFSPMKTTSTRWCYIGKHSRLTGQVHQFKPWGQGLCHRGEYW
jgi:hypothetical protein